MKFIHVYTPNWVLVKLNNFGVFVSIQPTLFGRTELSDPERPFPVDYVLPLDYFQVFISALCIEPELIFHFGYR